jgi:hypothetical protein
VYVVGKPLMSERFLGINFIIFKPKVGGRGGDIEF